jgi:hypothetical protein
MDALRLARRLATLPEQAMRRVLVAEELRAAPPAAVVDLLDELVRASRSKAGPPWSTALEALATALDGPGVDYELRSDLYIAAKERGRLEVARLFFAALGGVPEEPREEETEGRVVMPNGKPLTLGERKALARGGRRDLLLRLARDPDAQVVRIVLENPRMTERDVVAIAARRPTAEGALRAIFASRWLARYAVKRALVMNPYTPTDLAVRLCSTLVAPDLRAIAADENLAPPVRDQARALSRIG